ncbi:MAG: translocation/assembly module TamB [Bacteroidales bacterium]|nr:translocation/assembly module TamB [Bacteroidales bacterium]
MATLYFVFRTSAVQTYVSQRIASYLSKELKTEIKIGGVDISYFLNIVLENIEIKDQHKNILFSSKKLYVKIDEISIARRKINFNKIRFKDAGINLRKYRADTVFNYQFIVDYFSPKSKDTTKEKLWEVLCRNFEFENSSLKYCIDKYITSEKNSECKLVDFNDIDLKNLNLKIHNIKTAGDTVFADIKNISLIEKSGFKLNEFSSTIKFYSDGFDVNDIKIKTPQSNLSLNASFGFKSSADFNDFERKVKIKSIIKEAGICFGDIGYFAKELCNSKNIVKLSGELSGRISDFKGKNIDIQYGSSTHFYGNIQLTGLPYSDETFMFMTIKELITSKRDLEKFDMPSQSGQFHVVLPDYFNSMGDIKYVGKLTGFFNDFVSNGKLYTNLGMVSTDLELGNVYEADNMKYNGHLKLDNFDIGKFMDYKKWVGRISMDAKIKGKSFDPDKMSAEITANIGNIEFNGYNYKNILASGDVSKRKFNGNLNIRDNNINLDFSGQIDYSQQLPVFDFKSSVANANLKRLNLIKSDSINPVIANSSIRFNFTGNTLDNIRGLIEIENTKYIQNGRDYEMDKLFIKTSEDNGTRKVEILSDFVDANIEGIFKFRNLPNSIVKVFNKFLPSYHIKVLNKADQNTYEDIAFNIDVINAEPLSDIFFPSFRIAPQTSIFGYYNSQTNLLAGNIKSPEIVYNQQKAVNLKADINIKEKTLSINTNCSKLFLSNNIFVENFSITSHSRNDSLGFDINWQKHDSTMNMGNIKGIACFKSKSKIDLSVFPSNIIINDSVWQLKEKKLISIDSSYVHIDNLIFSSNLQKLNFNGIISKNPKDSLFVDFTNFNIANLNPVIKSSGYVLSGTLSGKTSLSDLYSTLNLNSDIIVRDLIINQDALGVAYLKSTWNTKTKSLNVDATAMRGNLKTFNLEGYYYPAGEKLDFDITLDKLKLQMFKKYVTDVFSDMRGEASGKLKLKGTLSNPDLSGKLLFQRTFLRVDYTNAGYSFANEIGIAKNKFIFENIEIFDSLGNKAVLNGKITHNNFKDFKFDLNIDAKKFVCLNTNMYQNNLYYGKGFFTGIIEIKGTPQNVDINITGKTEKGTRFFIPLTETSESYDNSFITFETKDSSVKTQQQYEVNLAGIKLNFDLNVTPEAEVFIIFDARSGDIMRGKGSGDMKFLIDTKGDFNMYGNYIIEEGDYLFTLQNLINKKFHIEKGGTLKWNGDPYDAEINIEAIYKVRTTLSVLEQTFDSTKRNERVPVECKIFMKDKLFNPTISFDVGFPTLTDDESDKYKAIIQPDMNYQIISLLALNSFVTPSNMRGKFSENQASGTKYGVGAKANSSELLSNQLNNWLSQISKDFDIGVNYRPGDQLNNDEVQVALSTQIFNDRVSVDGNFGVAGNKDKNASNIVGDVNIEAKLTEEGGLRVKAFNKTNSSNDIIYKNAPYTQGIGLFYRKEFDTLREMLKRKKEKKKKPKS